MTSSGSLRKVDGWQTLGTALGDWMADDTGLGYEGGALVFAAGLAVLAAAYFWTHVSRVFLFWAAFILSRPLGATGGNGPSEGQGYQDRQAEASD